MKKTAIILGLLVLINVSIFADDDYDSMPKNAITLDLFWLPTSLLVLSDSDFTGGMFWSTYIQYERHITEGMSLAGNIGYRSIGNIDGYILSAVSLEAHIRSYPGGKRIFFVDGMLGYALFNYTEKGDNPKNIFSHYFKFGGKLGWRIDFGKPGGFILEPSFGYYIPVGRTRINSIEGDGSLNDFFNFWLNTMSEIIIQGFVVGGPQLSLSFGYRF
ncbi:MAG: hypothetical protein LBU88_02695 [Treponema sp.]|jgi:hypothetical protein|nr:hypothetical protein [Treponema sp.]